MSETITAAIVGGSGYVGGELLRLLLGHPGVTVRAVTSASQPGVFVHGAHPNLRGVTDLKFTSPDALEPVDVLFLAQRHGESAKSDRSLGRACRTDRRHLRRLPAARCGRVGEVVRRKASCTRMAREVCLRPSGIPSRGVEERAVRLRCGMQRNGHEPCPGATDRSTVSRSDGRTVRPCRRGSQSRLLRGRQHTQRVVASSGAERRGPVIHAHRAPAPIGNPPGAGDRLRARLFRHQRGAGARRAGHRALFPRGTGRGAGPVAASSGRPTRTSPSFAW